MNRCTRVIHFVILWWVSSLFYGILIADFWSWPPYYTSYSRLCCKIQCRLQSYKITIHIYSSLLTYNNKNNLKKNTLFLIIKKLHGSRVGLLHSSDVAWTVCLNKAQDKRSSTLATMTTVVNQEQFSLLEKKVKQTQIEKI